MDKTIQQHWKREIEEEANAKSPVAFLNRSHNVNLQHLIWETSTTDPQDIRRAVIKAKMLAGAYILQQNKAAFKQTHNTVILWRLCDSAEENIPHFLITYPALSAVRDPVLEVKFPSCTNSIPIEARGHNIQPSWYWILHIYLWPRCYLYTNPNYTCWRRKPDSCAMSSTEQEP